MPTMQVGSPTALDPSPRAWRVSGADPRATTSNAPPGDPTLCRAPRAATISAVATVIFTDAAGPFATGSWTVDWGDGQTTTNTFSLDDNAVFDIFAGHVYDYATVGHVDVNLTVMRDGGETLTRKIGGVDIVYDELPNLRHQSLSPASPNMTELASFTQTVTEGLTPVASGSISWGDGHTDTVSYTDDGTEVSAGMTNHIYTITATHTYATPGSYALQTHVTDTDGQSNDFALFVEVVDYPDLSGQGGNYRAAFE